MVNSVSENGKIAHIGMEMRFQRVHCCFKFQSVEYYCSKVRQMISVVNAARRPGSD